MYAYKHVIRITALKVSKVHEWPTDIEPLAARYNRQNDFHFQGDPTAEILV